MGIESIEEPMQKNFPLLGGIGSVSIRSSGMYILMEVKKHDKLEILILTSVNNDILNN